MRAKIEDAIKNLGSGTKQAGPCGLLRVVFSHPAPPDNNTLEEAAEEGHPVATVPLALLEPTDSDLGQTILSLAKQALEKPDRKRKSSDEIVGARPKRLRRGTDDGDRTEAGNRQKKGNRQKGNRQKGNRQIVNARYK
jgi:hypothetical protein